MEIDRRIYIPAHKKSTSDNVKVAETPDWPLDSILPRSSNGALENRRTILSEDESHHTIRIDTPTLFIDIMELARNKFVVRSEEKGKPTPKNPYIYRVGFTNGLDALYYFISRIQTDDEKFSVGFAKVEVFCRLGNTDVVYAKARYLDGILVDAFLSDQPPDRNKMRTYKRATDLWKPYNKMRGVITAYPVVIYDRSTGLVEYNGKSVPARYQKADNICSFMFDNHTFRVETMPDFTIISSVNPHLWRIAFQNHIDIAKAYKVMSGDLLKMRSIVDIFNTQRSTSSYEWESFEK